MKLKKLFARLKSNPAAINAIAMAVLVYASNTRCAWIGHQPEMPDEVRKFKKL